MIERHPNIWNLAGVLACAALLAMSTWHAHGHDYAQASYETALAIFVRMITARESPL